MSAGERQASWEEAGVVYLVSRTATSPEEASEHLLGQLEARITDEIFRRTGSRGLADRIDMSLAGLFERQVLVQETPRTVEYAGLYRAFLGLRVSVLGQEVRTRQQVSRLAWVWMFVLAILLILGVWSAYFRVLRFVHRGHAASLLRAAVLVTLGVFAVVVAVSRMLPELI